MYTFICPHYSNFPYPLQSKAWHHWIFTGTIFLSILAFWPWHWLGFTLPKTLILSLGLSTCFLLTSITGIGVRFWKKELWPVGAYFGWLLIYTFLSISPVSSLLGASGMQWGWMTQLLYLGVFLLAMNMSKKVWIKIIVWLNALVAGYALIQFLGLDPLQSFWHEEAFLHRSFSVLGNPNWLASFLVLSFPVVFYELHSRKRQSQISLSGILFIILNLLALFTTASKAGFLAALFLMIATLRHKTKHWKKVVIGLMILILLGLPYFYSDGWALTRSLGSRLHIWKSAWQAFLAWPWGYGLDTFWMVFPPFSGNELWATEGLNVLITHPHNLILEKLLSIGPWGLFLFAWMLFNPLKKAWKQNNEQKWIAYGIIAYLITLLFGFEVMGTEILFWLFFGSVFYKKELIPKKSRLWQRILAGVFGVIFLLISVFHFQHVRGNIAYQQGRVAQNKNEIGMALNHFEQAIELYPYDRIYLLQSVEILLALKSEEENYLNQAEKHLNQLSKISQAQDPELPIFNAWLAAKLGNLEQFRWRLERAFSSHPSSGNNYKIAFHLYQKLSWWKEYEMLKKEFFEKLPDYWNQPETTAGRIFQKNHAWVMELE